MENPKMLSALLERTSIRNLEKDKEVSDGILRTINPKRGGKVISPEVVERSTEERSYGKSHANYYNEEFVKTTNKKLIEFLRKQNCLEINEAYGGSHWQTPKSWENGR